MAVLARAAVRAPPSNPLEPCRPALPTRLSIARKHTHLEKAAPSDSRQESAATMSHSRRASILQLPSCASSCPDSSSASRTSSECDVGGSPDAHSQPQLQVAHKAFSKPPANTQGRVQTPRVVASIAGEASVGEKRDAESCRGGSGGGSAGFAGSCLSVCALSYGSSSSITVAMTDGTIRFFDASINAQLCEVYVR